MSIVKRLLAMLKGNPASVAAVAQVAVALITMRYHPTAKEAAAIDGGAIAVLGLIVAALTKPFHIQALSGIVTAAGTLLAAYGAHMSPGLVSVMSAVLGAAALLARAPRTKTTAAAAKQAAMDRHPASPAPAAPKTAA